jgi:hypothetical protein
MQMLSTTFKKEVAPTNQYDNEGQPPGPPATYQVPTKQPAPSHATSPPKVQTQAMKPDTQEPAMEESSAAPKALPIPKAESTIPDAIPPDDDMPF